MSDTTVKNISGPFGHYPWGSVGAVLNSAVNDEHVSLTNVENFRIADRTIEMSGKTVGRFRWFDGLDRPLFMWMGELANHRQQDTVVNIDNGKDLSPAFRLSLSCHDMPAFEINGELATPQLHEFLMGMLTNWMDDPRYKIHKDAQAFFQGGYDRPDDKWFLIEFWNPKGAQAFIDYMNEHYKFGPHEPICEEF